MDRLLEAKESRLQMLRQLTMDNTGNSVLSDAVILDLLFQITSHLNDDELKHCVIIAIRNAFHRSNNKAPQRGTIEAVRGYCNT
jgi:hypothetical protein